jgi:hypothetical protein
MSATVADKIDEGEIKNNENENLEENNISNHEEENKINEEENNEINQNNNEENSNNENINQNENEEKESNNSKENEENTSNKNNEEEEEEKKLNISKKDETENKSISYYYKNNISKNTIIETNSEGQLHIGNNPFVTTGYFMQMNPHFYLLNRNIDTLRDTIYNETKKCLVLKGSLQQSENIIREESINVVKDVFEKIHMVRTMCQNEAKSVTNLFSKVNAEFNKISKTQHEIKKEIEICNYRINHCENDIGYRMLVKPHYSFLRKTAYK